MGDQRTADDPDLRVAFYSLPPAVTASRLCSRLRRRFDGLSQERHSGQITLFDSFDWRLFKRGWLAIGESGGYRLLDIHTDQTLASWAAPKTKGQPRFWWELPESIFQQRLRHCLGVRALLPRLRAIRTVITLNLLNPERKTVARVHLDTLQPVPGGEGFEPLQQCRLCAIRGYDGERRQAELALSEWGLTALPEHGLINALRRAGLQPGGYSTSPSLPLPPEMPTAHAGRRILSHLAGIMAQNVDGIVSDLDSECLHDFRVALRRARSLLTLLEDALACSDGDALKSALRDLGQATNALRDVDVYLLHRADYEALLPGAMRPAIAPLFAGLRRQRRHELRAIGQLLCSEGFRATLRWMENALDACPTAAQTPAATDPVGVTARRVIARRLRRVLKRAGLSDADSTDETLHRLRIECKKLRYALEFFAAFFEPVQMAQVVGQLKELQDYLGRINDLAVQQRFLDGFLKAIPDRQAGDLALTAAVGALIGCLHLNQRQERARLGEMLGRFSAKSSRRRFRRLLASPETMP